VTALGRSPLPSTGSFPRKREPPFPAAPDG